ncbi:Protein STRICTOSIDINE SYNTHASE-LIKE 4 like [Actinidia chinensis var. chinensis]|uniref:Protein STRICTOSIDINE SYNTHASE-LIKE 4 like n=1 Tax=Actinidia chinensis var. chinensis TaxID=1590841 RepID=A0A2R6Q581_ACTCC|nr:Protein STRICTOSIDINE SYNTHASE-LIKE 4 like [Actinidia chinensis var. chinensis]
MDSIAASARTSRTRVCSCFVLSCLLAITLQVFVFSPISPDILELPPASSASLVPTNSRLQTVIKLGEGFLEYPEDVCVDKNGILYTATRDGWIKRLHRNGSWENWRKIDSNALLGITITKAGSLIVCDGEKGLFKVNEDGVTVLTSHVKGTEIRFADDVIEASDGSLYFSVASTKFGFYNVHLDFLEAKPNGQLLKYDPSSNDTSVVIDGLYFANGVALSTDQDYLVVCETWKYRCLKYWLSGEDKGKTQIFVDNLPGAPDNINLAPDGSYWIALLQLFSSKFEFLHTSKAFRYLAATYPGLYELVKGTDKKAMVVNVAADGKIIRSFDDPTGEVMSFVTSAVEFDDHLYLGSLNSNFVGKLPLNVA